MVQRSRSPEGLRITPRVSKTPSPFSTPPPATCPLATRTWRPHEVRVTAETSGVHVPFTAQEMPPETTAVSTLRQRPFQALSPPAVVGPSQHLRSVPRGGLRRNGTVGAPFLSTNLLINLRTSRVKLGFPDPIPQQHVWEEKRRLHPDQQTIPGHQQGVGESGSTRTLLRPHR